MRAPAHPWHRPTLPPWLIGCGLCLCMFVAWAQDDAAPWASERHAEETRKNLQQLSRQIEQLRRSTAQAQWSQKTQSQAVQQQIAGIERQQNLLNAQLTELHHHSLRQIDDLQAVNRKLVAALWSVGAVAAGVLVLIWRRRQTAQSPSPSPLPADSANTAEPWLQAESAQLTTTASDARQEAPQEAPSPLPDAEPTTATSTATATATAPAPAPEADAPPLTATAPILAPSPEVSTPWSAWVSADLQDTQQTLLQARQGFMQPAPTAP